MADLLKASIIGAMRAFIGQSPGMEPMNYCSWQSYRAEARSVTRDLHDARELLRAVEWHESISGADLLAAFRAFSGRLSCTVTDGDKGPRVTLSYCTGQYFPTEFRKAAAAVCAAALWDWQRGNMPEPETVPVGSETVYRAPGNPKQKVSAGTWLRETFKREFGRRLGSRYFD